eukprot:TRINITY_DN10274_c0_g1_i1.p1 TRINITY_DN10274_c0_g1~~TRINITY_DN10274_c0_g1_i1.p1  ORF type:complete len:173 (+),score=41.96 TRINITY_DN10274_c0_g1_i1:33-551(+)
MFRLRRLLLLVLLRLASVLLYYVCCLLFFCFVFFFFSSRRRHTRCREVSWARRCVQETGFISSARLFTSADIFSIPFFSESKLDNNFLTTSIFFFYVRQHSLAYFWLIGKCALNLIHAKPLYFWILFYFILNHFLYPMYSALIPVSYTHLTLPTILLVQISVVAVSLKKKKQ